MAPSTSPRFHQMMQIGARVLRSRARALRIERARIVGIAGIAQIEPAAPGEGLVMAPRPRRHHAVEHVDAAGDGLEHILRRAHAHEIARPILRQHRRGHRNGVEHGLLPLANGKPADGIAVEADVLQNSSALLAQVRIDAALHDAEQRLARRGSAFETPASSAPPSASTAPSRTWLRRASRETACIRRAPSGCRRRAGIAPRWRAQA